MMAFKHNDRAGRVDTKIQANQESEQVFDNGKKEEGIGRFGTSVEFPNHAFGRP
jgi:hypothetical protein